MVDTGDDGKVYTLRFGYPEVFRGDLYVPEDTDRAREEGYIRWWKHATPRTIQEMFDTTEEVDADLGSDTGVGDPEAWGVPLSERLD